MRRRKNEVFVVLNYDFKIDTCNGYCGCCSEYIKTECSIVYCLGVFMADLTFRLRVDREVPALFKNGIYAAKKN